MSEFEREERAFRQAFAEHAAGAPEAARPVVRRRARWLAPALVAAVVLAVVGGTTVILRDSGPTPVRPAESSTYWETHAWRWIGIRDVEVKAPAGWGAEFGPDRPDCIGVGTDDAVTAGSVPPELKDPYVVLGETSRPTFTIGCSRDRKAGDPDPIFGQIPFPLWQPYVKVVDARKVGRPEHRDTRTFRDWKLTRVTTHGLQITVLSAPGDDELAGAVLDSLRTVSVNDLGCPVESEILSMGTARIDLDGRPLPQPEDVRAIAVCEYVQSGSRAVLNGSRRIVGEAAVALTAAILEAPVQRRPIARLLCRSDSPSPRGVALEVFTDAGPGVRPTTGAYLFVDGCGAKGILEPGGIHPLTSANCAPVFAVAPIGLFSAGSAGIYSRCHTR